MRDGDAWLKMCRYKLNDGGVLFDSSIPSADFTWLTTSRWMGGCFHRGIDAHSHCLHHQTRLQMSVCLYVCPQTSLKLWNLCEPPYIHSSLLKAIDLATLISNLLSHFPKSSSISNTNKMESIDPTYPPFSSSSCESNYPSFSSNNPSPPSPDPADRASQPAPTTAPSFDGWQPSNLLPQPYLYSPNRAEIESHPIRQRLSLGHEELPTTNGEEDERDEDICKDGSEERSLAQQEAVQAQEGSERLFHTMSSDAPAPQVGDAGMYLLCAWGAALG